MRKTLVIFTAIVLFALAFTSCGNNDNQDNNDLQEVIVEASPTPTPTLEPIVEQSAEVVFSDILVSVDFFNINLSASEDIRYSTSDVHLWLYFTDESLPMVMFMHEGTTRSTLTETEARVFLDNVGRQLSYDDEDVSWSDIERIVVNGMPLYLASTRTDGESLGVIETLDLMAGIFVADQNIFSVVFAADLYLYNIYLPHFRKMLYTISVIADDEIVLLRTGFAPENLDLSRAFLEAIDTDIIDFYFTHPIIFTTTAEENGLGDTFMYIDGVVYAIGEPFGPNDVIKILTNNGLIALILPNETIDLLSLPYNLELFAIDREFGFFFLYMGFSSVLDMPAGMLVGLHNYSEPEPSPEPTPTQEPLTLVGTWLWMGSPYYVFEPGGRGTMAGVDIRWTARNGILSICNTPDLCGNTCIAPAEWRYVLSGNQLTLTSTLIDTLTFTYTRR